MGGLDRAVAAAFRLPVLAHAEPEKIRARLNGPLVPNPSIAVLEARFPGVPNIGDIVEADWSPWREACTVLCAGFPCQPVSAAGRRLAENDERWLWPAVHRAVLELAPEWVVLENVANIVSIQGGAVWRKILDDLRIAGYDVAWGIFGACLVGACHHRHRMFLVARRSPDGWLGGLVAQRWQGKPCGASRATVLPTPVARDASTRGEGSPGYWLTKRATGWTGGAPLGAELALLPTPRAIDGARGVDGPSRTVESGRKNGVELASALVELLPTPTAQSYGSNQGGAAGRVGPVRQASDALARLELMPTPKASHGRGMTAERNNRGEPGLISAVMPEHFGRFATAVGRWTGVHGVPPAPTEMGPRGGVRMDARFPEWMMGLAPGYVTDILPRNEALARIGNGVMPQQGFYAIGELLAMLR